MCDEYETSMRWEVWGKYETSMKRVWDKYKTNLELRAQTSIVENFKLCLTTFTKYFLLDLCQCWMHAQLYFPLCKIQCFLFCWISLVSTSAFFTHLYFFPYLFFIHKSLPLNIIGFIFIEMHAEIRPTGLLVGLYDSSNYIFDVWFLAF